MIIWSAFKYELMPTGEQRRDMRRFAGSCRFVFNKALALQKERYEQDIKKAEEAIRQAQASIEENVQAQGAAQEQIKQQQELIEATRRKLNDL